MDIIREATKLKEIALSIAKTKGISNLEAWPEAISIYKLNFMLKARSKINSRRSP